MTPLSLIWLIFTIIFFLLAIFHFNRSTHKIDDFKVTKRPLNSTSKVIIQGLGVDQPLNEFAEDFNKYLKSYNNSIKSQCIFAGTGYLAACLVSIVTLLLEMEWI